VALTTSEPEDDETVEAPSKNESVHEPVKRWEPVSNVWEQVTLEHLVRLADWPEFPPKDDIYNAVHEGDFVLMDEETLNKEVRMLNMALNEGREAGRFMELEERCLSGKKGLDKV
jgi:hypothetical protein